MSRFGDSLETAMPKRPKAIYFIALWTLIASHNTVLPIASWLFPYDGLPVNAPWLQKITFVLSMGFVLYVTLGLIQLRAVPRWLVVGLMATWVGVVMGRLLTPGAQDPIGVVASVTVLMISGWTIWALIRPNFRRLANAYRQERAAEAWVRFKRQTTLKVRSR